MSDNQQNGFRALPMGLVSWFVAGIGLTLGHLFTMWLLRICHLA